MTKENSAYRAIITGGSSGIGKAITQLFIDKGFEVIVIARDEAKLAQTKSETSHPDNCHTYSCDVSNKTELRHCLKKVMNDFSDFDVLINNAGVFIPGGILEEKDETYQTTMQTNIDSVYYTCKSIIPKLNSNSYIFNMCSTASQIGYPDGGSYCISKFALLGLTKALRLELMGRHAVSAIMPGATLTNSWAGTTEPKSRFMKPQDVALMIWAAWQVRSHTVVEELVMRPQLGDFK